MVPGHPVSWFCSPGIRAPKPSRAVPRVLLPVILASDPGRAVRWVLLPRHPGTQAWPGGPPGFAPRASWFPTLAERSGGWLPLRLPSAIFRKPPARSFGGRKDSEYLLIVSTSGYIYVRIVWLIPGGQVQVMPAGQTSVMPAGQTQVMPAGQAPVMPAGQAPVMPAGQTWRFFQIAHTL